MVEKVLRLANRALAISYKKKISHLGSTLSSLPIIWDIFTKKKEKDSFVLSNGHAGLALYTVLEELYGLDAEALFDCHGVHPVRSTYIDCSTGSLGCGLPIAAGIALGNPHNVYCIISDGECAQGSIWESLRFINDFNIDNLSVYLDMNGFSAYGTINKLLLEKRLIAFYPLIKIRQNPLKQFDFINGLNYHYKILNEEEYIIIKESGIYA
jgi:transketolase